MRYGIPVENGGKLASWKDNHMMTLLAFAPFANNKMLEKVQDVLTVTSKVLEMDTMILSSDQLTLVLKTILDLSFEKGLSMKTESAIKSALEVPMFNTFWKTGKIPEDIVTLFNKELVRGFHRESSEHSSYDVPPFVTPLGPSVYKCKCGMWFGDPTKELTCEVVDDLKKNKIAHLKRVYGTNASGYPTERSATFSLHRAVQEVAVTEFKSAKKRDESFVEKVICKLKKRGKGNLHYELLKLDVEKTIDSYLACRAAGMAEPIPLAKGKVHCYFKDKAMAEQKILLEQMKC